MLYKVSEILYIWTSFMCALTSLTHQVFCITLADKNNTGRVLSWRERLRIAVDAAQGYTQTTA